MNLELASLANLTHFIQTMEERPSVKAALAAEKNRLFKKREMLNLPF